MEIFRGRTAIFAPAALANHPSQYGGAMTQEKKAAAHAYTVELSFYGDQLDPSEISACLNLQPSGSLSQSQIQLTTRKRRPYWGYNGQGEMGFQLEWACLEEGLEFLLKNLRSRKPEILTLARQFDAAWWCGHFQTSFDGGPTLSPKLLTEIGSFGIPLSIDNYFSGE
jgi:hypothetical protein